MLTDPAADPRANPDADTDPDAQLRRWRLDVRYDGTDFSGWAAQPGRRTVQGVLQDWLARVLRLEQPPTLTCAGRTDAGVHARGQVCQLDLPGHLLDDGEVLRRRLARALPPDVAVGAVTAAPDGFDARFSAVWRHYCYRLSDGPPPDPLLRRFVAHWPEALDVNLMQDAGSRLLGLRDFGAFCKRRDGASTIRQLLDCRAARVGDAATGPVLEISLRADAFCHSMVRSLVGALVRVGSGRRDPAWPLELTGTPTRASSVPVLPAHGLTLEQVGYPAADQLARRAGEARSVRTLPDAAGCDGD